MRLLLKMLAVPALLAGCAGGLELFRPPAPETPPPAAERPNRLPPPPGYYFRELTFADTEAFDAMLESYLVNGMPAIRIVMDSPRPAWPPRMVAWLKAYEWGGKVSLPAVTGMPVEGAWLAGKPLGDPETLAMLDSVLYWAERKPTSRAEWWEEIDVRNKRTMLLRPYVIDALRDPNRGGNFVVMLYNGRYE